MMKQSAYLALIFTPMLLVSGCNNPQSNNPSPSQAEAPADNSVEGKAWKMIEQGALLVDVRTPDEHNQGFIHGSLLIPHDQIAARINEFGADKSRPIVLYCRSGKRAGKAEALLRENGYSNVLNAGGYTSMMKHKQP